MTDERTWWETIKVEGGELLERVKDLVHEGNVRRIVIRQGDRSVAEFPLTIGVVGTVAAPMLAAVGAIAALLTNCSIAVQREAPSSATGPDVSAADKPSSAANPAPADPPSAP